MVDVDNTKQIGFAEFVEMIRKILKLGAKLLPEDALKSIWRALDRDGSNHLTVQEFAEFMKRGARDPLTGQRMYPNASAAASTPAASGVGGGSGGGGGGAGGGGRGGRGGGGGVDRGGPNRRSVLHAVVSEIAGDGSNARRTTAELGRRNPAWPDRLLLELPAGGERPPQMRVQLFESGFKDEDKDKDRAGGGGGGGGDTDSDGGSSGGGVLVAEAEDVTLVGEPTLYGRGIEGRMLLLLRGVGGRADVYATFCFRCVAAPPPLRALTLPSPDGGSGGAPAAQTLLLRLRGLRAFDVPALDKGGLSDPYLKIGIAPTDGGGGSSSSAVDWADVGQAKQTAVINGTRHPKWRGELNFAITPDMLLDDGSGGGDGGGAGCALALCVALMDEDKKKEDDLIAQHARLPFAGLVCAAGQIQWVLRGADGAPNVRIGFRYLIEPLDPKRNSRRF